MKQGGFSMSIQTIRRSAVAAAGIGILAFGGLFAGKAFAHGSGDGFSGGFGPRMFQHMARTLDLTDDQRAQVKGVLKNHITEIESQVQAGITARQALHDAINAQPINEPLIRSKALELGAVHAEGAVLFARIRAEVVPLLTADQKDKMQKIHDHMQQKGQNTVKSLDTWLRSDS
jgi:Spy/CpxP family protein refolding chaperone